MRKYCVSIQESISKCAASYAFTLPVIFLAHPADIWINEIPLL